MWQEHCYRCSLGCLHCCFSKFDIAEWQDELQKPAWLTHTMNRTACTCLEQAVTHSRVYSNYIVLVEFDVHLRVMRQPVKQCCWNQRRLHAAPPWMQRFKQGRCTARAGWKSKLQLGIPVRLPASLKEDITCARTRASNIAQFKKCKNW